MKNYKIYIAGFLIIGIAFGIWQFSGTSNLVINNFEECIAAGNPVMESYPEQCRTKDGRTFARELGPRAQAFLACSTADIPDVSVDTFLDKNDGSVEVRWNDPVTGKEILLTLPYDPIGDFSGCSDSAKRVLRSVADTDGEVYMMNPPNSAEGAPAGSIHNLPIPTAVAIARSYAAQRAKINESEVLILTVFEKEWPDACLGMPGNIPEDQFCAQVITPGYEVTMIAKGQEFIYRTNMDGTQVRVAK